MRKETKTIERTVKEERTFIYADDGTQFYSEEECKKYEEGAAFACKVAIKSVLTQVENDSCFKQLLMDGCGDDYETYIFRPKTKEDVKTFLQWSKVTKVPVTEKPKVIPEYHQWSPYLYAEDIEPEKEYIVFHHETYWCGVASIASIQKVMDFCKEVMNNI